MTKTVAIITAGGTGKRMKSSLYKQFIEIGGIPILALTLMQFQRCELIDGIIVTSPGDVLFHTAEEIIDRYNITKVLKVVEGGSERQFSVLNALETLSENTEFVLIHDGVRPFITQSFLRGLIKQGYLKKAVIPGLKPKETIKKISDSIVEKTLNRQEYILVQTPQMFEYKTILKAYKMAPLSEKIFTDDASIMEFSGLQEVFYISGLHCNIKITTPEDLQLAEYLFEQYLKKELL